MSNINKLTVVMILERLKEYDAYKDLSDYQIKKQIGSNKLALQQELVKLINASPKRAPKNSPKPSPKSSPKASPKRSPKASPKTAINKTAIDVTLKCIDKSKYIDKYCNATTGVIIAKNKNGRPRAEHNFDTNYIVNENYRLVGLKQDVEAHIDYFNKLEKPKMDNQDIWDTFTTCLESKRK